MLIEYGEVLEPCDECAASIYISSIGSAELQFFGYEWYFEKNPHRAEVKPSDPSQSSP